jgi:hypothetical protein
MGERLLPVLRVLSALAVVVAEAGTMMGRMPEVVRNGIQLTVLVVAAVVVRVSTPLERTFRRMVEMADYMVGVVGEHFVTVPLDQAALALLSLLILQRLHLLRG